MSTISKLLLLILTTITLGVYGQSIKNSKTITTEISGNCGMCKEAIESAAFIKKVSAANWDGDTKLATITFDTTKTNVDAILKRIAYAGYDNENYLAPTEAYNNLPGCCQYDREKFKTASISSAQAIVHDESTPDPDSIQYTAAHPLSKVFEAYFNLKDALIKSNGELASGIAKGLFKEIDAVNMNALPQKLHVTWMNYMTKLSYDAEHIKGTKEIEHQRDHFTSLSKNMYEVMKVANPGYEIYYDHCPMYNEGKGANWLSKEPEINNPYYGNQMLRCGSVTDTLR